MIHDEMRVLRERLAMTEEECLCLQKRLDRIAVVAVRPVTPGRYFNPMLALDAYSTLIDHIGEIARVRDVGAGRMAALLRERDELAALVLALRDALKTAGSLIASDLDLGDPNEMCVGSIRESVQRALALPAPAALVEIKARCFEKAATMMSAGDPDACECPSCAGARTLRAEAERIRAEARKETNT